MARLGMDVDEVERVAGQLRQQAGMLQQAISQINGLVTQATQFWDGSDSKQFQQWWVETHKPNLENAKQALEELSETAKKNAQQQREVSGQ